MGLVNLFHRWLNPHCEYCNHCPNCEVLRSLLDTETFEKNKLLQQLLNAYKPSVDQPIIREAKPEEVIRRKHIPWAVKRQMLENEDRNRMQLIHEQERIAKDISSQSGGIQFNESSGNTIEELEKELGVVSDS